MFNGKINYKWSFLLIPLRNWLNTFKTTRFWQAILVGISQDPWGTWWADPPGHLVGSSGDRFGTSARGSFLQAPWIDAAFFFWGGGDWSDFVSSGPTVQLWRFVQGLWIDFGWFWWFSCLNHLILGYQLLRVMPRNCSLGSKSTNNRHIRIPWDF